MDMWSVYQDRVAAHGGTKRGASLVREVRFINTKLPDNLSYQTVDVYPQEYGYNIETDECMDHMYSQNVAIINSDNLNEKTIISLPSDDIILGSLIFWMDNYWLVVERDANTTVYTRAKLLQCNHLLKWVAEDDTIIEQWSVFDDGTKYLTGYYEDKDFFTTRGDSRISLQIARNQYTIRLGRNNRFLVGDIESENQLAYQLTKPMKGNLTYDNKGTYSFVLQEVQSTDYDNMELGIADYYKHFPRDPLDEILPLPDDSGNPEDEEENKGKKVWI